MIYWKKILAMESKRRMGSIIARRLIPAMDIGMDVTDLKKAQAELEKLNTELEQRIAVRTKELSKVNRTLNAIGKSNKVMMHAKGEQQYLEEVCKAPTCRLIRLLSHGGRTQ